MQSLSKQFYFLTAIFQDFLRFLSINKNCSLGRLWKAFHNRPNEKWHLMARNTKNG